MAIEEILDLEQLEVNIYRGAVFSPESGFLQRTFGGHILGQSLVSAIRTVGPEFGVHSLHGYFLRPGDAAKPAEPKPAPKKTAQAPREPAPSQVAKGD